MSVKSGLGFFAEDFKRGVVGDAAVGEPAGEEGDGVDGEEAGGGLEDGGGFEDSVGEGEVGGDGEGAADGGTGEAEDGVFDELNLRRLVASGTEGAKEAGRDLQIPAAEDWQ